MQFFNHSSHCGPTIFIFVFSMQLTVNVQYKFLANDWIQTAYLWNWKRLYHTIMENIDKHNKRVRTDTPTLFDYAGGSVTRIFLSNVFKSCPK